MFSQTIKAALSATRLLFKSWSTLLLIVGLYSGLLFAGYLFVSTREATIWQLVLTLAAIVVAPVLFFALQAVSVNYASGPVSRNLIKKITLDSLRILLVTVPLIALTALACYGFGKIDSHPVVVLAVRYLLAGVIAPLLAIQLWVAVSHDGLKTLWRRLHQIAGRAFAPQSVLVYACGLLFFAVTPYLLIVHTTQSTHAWLEVSLLAGRLLLSASLILVGWVTTVRTLSLLAKN
jgi:hypothetical protein